jgi:hypothetical protein
MGRQKFEKSVSDSLEFCKYCKELGFTSDKVITSKGFELIKEKFDSKTLGELGLIDPQFSSKMPSDDTLSKYILPFTFLEGSVFAMVYGKPNTVVKEHSHTKGFLRTVMFGQYTFTGLPQGEITLEAGEWIYIPAEQKYGYITGPKGGGGGCSYCTGGGGGQCGPN